MPHKNKLKKKHDALAQADKGEEFDVTVTLDICVYGVESFTVRMKKNTLTELTECLFPGCSNSLWCTGTTTNAMHFAICHVNANHLPGKINSKTPKPKAARIMSSFFSSVPAPPKIDKYALRARAPIVDMTVEPLPMMSTRADLVGGGSFQLHEPLLVLGSFSRKALRRRRRSS